MTDDHDLPEEITLTTRLENAVAAVPGSQTDNCLECGKTVVVSPGTRLSIIEGLAPDYIVYMTCMAQAEDEEVTDADD